MAFAQTLITSASGVGGVRARLAPEQRLVAFVVRVRHERDAAREEFRTGRVDVDGAGVVGAVEGDAVIGAGPFAVLEFGLGDGGSKVDVPERRCFGGVDLLARQHLEEGALADCWASWVMRGTFANIRIRNKITPEIEGGVTKHFPSGEVMAIYDAAMRYKAEGHPAVIFAGKEYGTGSSRDWAAKGTKLLGVRAVIAESFERIHRSNLVGMGVLPLQFNEEGWQGWG